MIAKYRALVLRVLGIRASGLMTHEQARQWTEWVTDATSTLEEEIRQATPVRKQVTREPAACPGCGREFQPRRHDHRYCSGSCAGRAGWLAMQAKRAERNGHEPEPLPEPEVVKVAPALKRCSQCKEAKPVTEFSPDKKSRDRLRYECKACLAAEARERMRRKREQEREQKELPHAVKRARTIPEPRKCERCGEEYQPNKPDQRFCSLKCRSLYASERSAAKHRQQIAPEPPSTETPEQVYRAWLEAGNPCCQEIEAQIMVRFGMTRTQLLEVREQVLDTLQGRVRRQCRECGGLIFFSNKNSPVVLCKSCRKIAEEAEAELAATH